MPTRNQIRPIPAKCPEGNSVTVLEFTKFEVVDFGGFTRERVNPGLTYFLDGTFEPLTLVSEGVFQLTAGVRRFTAGK